MFGTRFHVHDHAHVVVAVVKLSQHGTITRETLIRWADHSGILLRPGTDVLGQRTVEVLTEVPAPNDDLDPPDNDSDRDLLSIAMVALPFVPQWDSRSAASLLRSIAKAAERIVRVE
jgi:hypothetical protein